MASAEQDAYDRGKVDGELVETVKGHGHHLARVNGSMEVVARTMAELVAGQHRIDQRMEADERTRIATADALREAVDARRQAERDAEVVREHRWTPWARTFATVGGIAGALAAVHGLGWI
jgi:phosphoserine phosphatase